MRRESITIVWNLVVPIVVWLGIAFSLGYLAGMPKQPEPIPPGTMILPEPIEE